MDIERRLETQRLRLLRLVTGLLAAVVFVLVQPFSPAASRWVGAGVLSILTRAELAAQYLVIVQARITAAGSGSAVDPERLREHGLRQTALFGDAGSLSDLRRRLVALKTLLEDLPRHGLRLLRRTEKEIRRLMGATLTHRVPQHKDAPDVVARRCAWRLARRRIERPPDKSTSNFCSLAPPPGNGREAKAVGH